MIYTNEQCPVCGKKFTDSDDIVVCPECGTPHHRQCYNDNGGCSNEGKHTEGFVWKKTVAEPIIQEQPQPVQTGFNPLGSGFGMKNDFQGNGENQHIRLNSNGHKVVFCPNCGKENAAEEPICTNCGARLYNAQNGGRPFVTPIDLPDMSSRQFGNGAIPISPFDKIGENTVGDTAEFIGVNANKYIPKMYKMEKEKKKASWNWAAFLFAPYWFFYRKIHTVGIILMVILLLTSVFCTNKSVFDAQESLMNTANEFYTGNATQEQFMQEYQAYIKMPQNLIMMGITVAVHIYAGIMGNYHYKKKVEKDVKIIREQSQNPEQYRINLFRRGGVSAFMLLLSLLAYNCVNSALSVVLTSMLK